MSYLKSKRFDDMVRQNYVEMTPGRISYKKFKAMVKKGSKQLGSGYSPLLLSFRYSGESERLEVVDHVTYLLSQEFEDSTRCFYDNDESVNSIVSYIMFKVATVYSSLMLLVHDIESKRSK